MTMEYEHISSLELGKDKRKVFIVDSYGDDEAIKMSYGFFKTLPYTLLDSDRPDISHIKHLIHNFGDNDPFLDFFTEYARNFMETQGITLGKVCRRYANFNLHGDFQYSHQDGDQWTALFFINETWHTDWAGELMIYHPQNEAYAYSIQPKPGRMVMFDGLLEHRGGVPSKLCFEPRISLAIKFFR